MKERRRMMMRWRRRRSRRRRRRRRRKGSEGTLRHRSQAPGQPELQLLPVCAFSNNNIMVRLMMRMI